jgi:hypothetical protein
MSDARDNRSSETPILGNFARHLFAWIAAVVAVWMVSATLILYWIVEWPARGQFGDLFGAVNSLFSGLAFAGLVVALLLQNHGLRLQLAEVTRDHDWNRKRAAHDLIFETSLGRFAELRRRTEAGIDIYDADQNSATVQLSEERKQDLDAVLNFLENVCLSMKNNVVDEEIVYKTLSDILLAYARWAAPYITESRQISPDFWKEIDLYVVRWTRRVEAERLANA